MCVCVCVCMIYGNLYFMYIFAYFRIEEELKNLHSTSEKKVTADEKKNTEKFLALTLPPSHNAGM